MAVKKYLDDVGTEYLVEKINDKIQLQFVGTKAEWEALSADEKAKYVFVNLTDDYTVTSAVVDEVTEGEGRAVSSGAVFNALNTVDVLSTGGGTSITLSSSGFDYKYLLIAMLTGALITHAVLCPSLGTFTGFTIAGWTATGEQTNYSTFVQYFTAGQLVLSADGKTLSISQQCYSDSNFAAGIGKVLGFK